MSKYLRAAILALVGFALEVGAAVALGLCYWLHHSYWLHHPHFIVVIVTLLVVSGCFFSLGIVAILYASLALGGSTSSSEVDRTIGT